MINFDVDTRGFQTFTQEAVKGLDADDQLKILRGIALKFISEVVPRTPVDTGQARGGWTAMKGSSRSVRIGGEPGGASRGRKQGRYKESKGRGEAGLEIFNGVPHIVYLELGSSQQAPGGFVRQVIREMQAKGEVTREFKRELEKQLRLANIKARALSGLRQGGAARFQRQGIRANIRARG